MRKLALCSFLFSVSLVPLAFVQAQSSQMKTNRELIIESAPVDVEPTTIYQEGESRPRFDWNKYRGQEKVPHPDAQKGLLRVTKDKVYIYGTKTSEQNRAFSFRFGYYDPSRLENPEAAGQPYSTISDNYDSTSNPTLLIDYEWQLFHLGLAKLGLKIGSGLYVAQGNGHFVTTPTSSDVSTPRERFTLLIFPNSLGVVARFQVWDQQFLVPYVDGGLTAFGMAEMRDDNQNTKFGGALATYAAAGGQLNLSSLDAISRAQLDREYGINRIYLVGEYRTIIGLSDKFDFTSDLINGGFLMEF